MKLQRSARKCHGNHNDSTLPRGEHDREGGRCWHAHSLLDSARTELSGAEGVFLESGFQKRCGWGLKVLKSRKCVLYMTDSLKVLKSSGAPDWVQKYTYTQGHNIGSKARESGSYPCWRIKGNCKEIMAAAMTTCPWLFTLSVATRRSASGNFPLH